MNGLTPSRTTVMGSGSVGLALAASFAEAGQSVTLPARGSALPLLREHGITVSGVCGDHRIGPDRLRVCDADEPDPQDIACDLLIVATKAHQVAEVLKRSMRMRNAEVAVAPKAVVQLQNGWGSADQARGRAGFLPITDEDEIEPAILDKFLFNSCLDAIGAITRMTYGELVSNEYARHLIRSREA